MAYKPNDFGYKDSLLSGDPEKVIRGSDFDVEFEAIADVLKDFEKTLEGIEDTLENTPGAGGGAVEPDSHGFENVVFQNREEDQQVISKFSFTYEDDSLINSDAVYEWAEIDASNQSLKLHASVHPDDNYKPWRFDIRGGMRAESPITMLSPASHMNFGAWGMGQDWVDAGELPNSYEWPAYVKYDQVEEKWSIKPNLDIEGNLTINGDIIIDGGQIVDPDGNPAGGVGAGNNIGDVPKWNGSEWVPTFYQTDDLNDVQSASASNGQFLIHNGSKWIAEDFHIDTTLVFQGAVDLTGPAPVDPANGDLYINDTDGMCNTLWGPIGGTNVVAGNVVGFSSAKDRWYLLGDLNSASVVQVRQGDCIRVDETDPARPVVHVDQATQDKIDLGVEAHSWGNHAGDINNLQGQINQEITDRAEGDKTLQDQIDDLKELEGGDVSSLQGQLNQEIQDRIDGDQALQDQIDQEITDRTEGDKALQGQIDQNKTDISNLQTNLNNHEHKLDDLSDVNASGPNPDDLIVWTGSNWSAKDYSFIQTALRFNGGIAPTAAAPSNPEGGDLYVFDANGTVSASWTGIAGRVVQAGKFVGYAAGTHNRWYLLGDMADVGVMQVVKGTGILVDSSNPAKPVVAAEFGTTSSTVARGNHNHDGVYEPVINPKLTAFNKNFGTGNGDVARGDHTHSQYLTSFTETDPTVPQHVKNITTTNISNWNTAYGWGNHATQGYLKSGDVPGTDLSNYYTKTESDNKYEPKIVTKYSAFNKNFGTAADTVAMGNHLHSQYADKGDTYTKAEIDALLAGLSTGGGGGMIKLAQQPGTAGNFTLQLTDQTYKTSVEVGSGLTKTLIVPNGMVFCFQHLFGKGGGSTGKVRVVIDGLHIDGVKVYPDNTGYIDYDTTGGPLWPRDENPAIIRVEERLEFRSSLSGYTSIGTLFLAGFFAEA